MNSVTGLRYDPRRREGSWTSDFSEAAVPEAGMSCVLDLRTASHIEYDRGRSPGSYTELYIMRHAVDSSGLEIPCSYHVQISVSSLYATLISRKILQEGSAGVCIEHPESK